MRLGQKFTVLLGSFLVTASTVGQGAMIKINNPVGFLVTALVLRFL